MRDNRNDKVTAALNAVSAKLTTETFAGLVKEADVDKKDPRPSPRSSCPTTAWADPSPEPAPTAPGPCVGIRRCRR